MPDERANYTAFVPQGENRRETARLLVDLANEHGIDQSSIRSTNRGFDITDELADLLYDESEIEDDDESTDAADAEPETTDAADAKTDPPKKRK